MTHPPIIIVPSVGSQMLVHVLDIIRLEGWQKYTRIFLQDGRILTSSYAIGKFEKQLPATLFLRTHKSYLLNLSYILALESGNIIRLKDGSCVPLARRKRKDFIELIAQHDRVS